MGNSGSLHNVAIGLDENHYPYQYHQQFHNQSPSPHSHNGHSSYPAQYPLHWTSSYSSTGSGSGPQSQPHIKVLPPEPSSLLRLRPTTNGTILHSGGTLSGRRESFNPALLLQRSRTTLNESPGFSRRISDTSGGIATPPTRPARPHPVLARRNAGSGMEAAAKRFGSVPDLRISVEDEMMPQQSDRKIAISKSRGQVRGEKDVADGTPTDLRPAQQQPQRKLRLFRTKAESRKLGPVVVNDRPAKLAAEASDFHFQRQYRDQTSNRHRDEVKAKPMPMPVFRREKSFDITLLRSRNKDLRPQQQHAAGANNGTSVPSPVPPDKSPVIRQRSVDTATGIEGNRQPVRSRKLSQLVVGELDGGRDFKRELEAATKRRSTVGPPDPEPRRQSQMQKALPSGKPSSKSRVLSKIATQLHKKEHREEPIKKPANDPVESKQRTVSKIPQLTKTFYFGMEKSPKADVQIVDRSTDRPTPSHDSENLAKIQMEVIDQFAKSIFTTPEFQREESESSESALSSDNAGMGVGATPYIVGIGSVEVDNDRDHEDDDDENMGQIQVHIRPTLPRRQLEIPRFSPAAAWRMLAEERFINGLSPIDSSSGKNEVQQVVQTQPPVPLEGRIQRIYREPNPMYPDNKSGDSGISGDAGLPERVESPKNQRVLTSQVGPFLTAWTPQQDLDEDDESSSTDDDHDGIEDGDAVDAKQERQASNKYPSRGHTFSLSLPRENQLSIYEEKEKPGFSSLQKLKRTVSGVFANQTVSSSQQRTSPTYCNDNWLLSRSAPNSIDSQVVTGAPGAAGSGPDTVRQSSSALSYLTAGKHVMYLPNQPIPQPETDFNATVLPAPNHTSANSARDEHIPTLESTNQISGRTRQRDVQRNVDPSLDDAHPAEDMEPTTRSANARKGRSGHRFTFQSTVRQIERRRIADKLSKEAEQKEAQRLSELEAMRRVEEEFQRKRAGEKASIRHQLRLFSLEENQCISLPVDWQSGTTQSPPQQSGGPSAHMDSSASINNSPAHQRAEPDGAVSSSPTSSPTLRPYSETRITTNSSSSSANASPMHYRRKNETSAKFAKSNARMRQPQHQPQSQLLLPPQTEILSEFRTPRREYFEYRSQTSSSNYRHKLEIGPPPPPQQTQHNEVVCQIPLKGQPSDETYGHEPDLNGNIRHYYHERRDSPLNGSRKMSR